MNVCDKGCLWRECAVCTYMGVMYESTSDCLKGVCEALKKVTSGKGQWLYG